MLVFATILFASFCRHGFSAPTTVIYFYCFFSTSIGIYVAWDMQLSLSKFYTYFSIYRACFSLLFNYTVIQLFFILFGRKYAALALSQLIVIFLNFINQKKQQYLFSNLSPEDIFLVPEAMKASPWLLQLVFFPHGGFHGGIADCYT